MLPKGPCFAGPFRFSARSQIGAQLPGVFRFALRIWKAGWAGGNQAAGKGAVALRQAVVANADRHAMDLAPAVADIRASGSNSLRAVAAALNARGMKTRRGGRWHVSNVNNLLQRLEWHPMALLLSCTPALYAGCVAVSCARCSAAYRSVVPSPDKNGRARKRRAAWLPGQA